MLLQRLRKLTGNPLYLVIMALFFAGLWLWHPIHSTAEGASAGHVEHVPGFRWFAPLLDYGIGERMALLGVLAIACAGLAYAAFLVRQVKEADRRATKIPNRPRRGTWCRRAAPEHRA